MTRKQDKTEAEKLADAVRSGDRRALARAITRVESTKPAGSVKIRVETISYYLGRYSPEIIARKKALAAPNCPLDKIALAS